MKKICFCMDKIIYTRIICNYYKKFELLALIDFIDSKQIGDYYNDDTWEKY